MTARLARRSRGRSRGASFAARAALLLHKRTAPVANVVRPVTGAVRYRLPMRDAGRMIYHVAGLAEI